MPETLIYVSKEALYELLEDHVYHLPLLISPRVWLLLQQTRKHALDNTKQLFTVRGNSNAVMNERVMCICIINHRIITRLSK